MFLTSTVIPNNKIRCVDDAVSRRKQYIEAIRFYLKRTKYEILIVDNSGYDFSNDFSDTRLECLNFIANSDDVNKGKGYGESLIIKYGLKNSKKLRYAQQIVKITGRLIVENVNLLLKTSHNIEAVYADTDINFLYAHSYFFVALLSFYTDYLLVHSSKMNDSLGIHFEHILGKCLKNWIKYGNRFHQFMSPIYLKGHTGETNYTYHKPSATRYIRIAIKYILTEFKIMVYSHKHSSAT